MPSSKRKERSRAGRAPTIASGWQRLVVRAIVVTAALGVAAIAGLFLRKHGSGDAAPSPSLPPDARPAIVSLPPRPAFDVPDNAAPGASAVSALRDEAFSIGEETVRTLPNNPHALCLLGSVHQRYAAEASARQLWEECFALDPQFADAHLACGLQANARSDYPVAEHHFRAALRADPGWDEVPIPLAQALLAQGKYRELVELLEPFVQVRPQAAEAWCRLGQAYAHLDDHWAARRCHLAAIEASPDSIDAHYGAGMACQKCGQNEQAERFLARFQELRSQEHQAIDDTRSLFTDENRARTTTVRTCLTAARIYAIHALPYQAESNWRRAANLDPHNIESREALCELFARQGRHEEALPFCQELCALEANYPYHWMRLGRLNGKSRRPAQAVDAFRRVIELAPDQAEAYAALAEIQLLPGRDAREAILLAGKAVELAPSARHHYVLGLARWGGGEMLQARASLEAALRLAPDEVEYRAAYARLVAGSRFGN